MESASYEIRTVGDFLAVPEGRRGVCLAEFAQWLELVANLRVLADTLNISGLPAKEESEVFRWVDDGLGEMRLRVTVHDARKPAGHDGSEGA